MKLLHYGWVGAEKLKLLGADGNNRDLSAFLVDIAEVGLDQMVVVG